MTTFSTQFASSLLRQPLRALLLGLLFAFAILTRLSAAPEPEWSWVGAVGTQAGTLKAAWPEGSPGTLLLSTSDNLSNSIRINGEFEEAGLLGKLATYQLTGLQPGTVYHYGWGEKAYGQFQTPSEGQSSFSLAFGSCAKTGSNHSVFEEIVRQEPLFFLHTGDLHYEDINRNDVDRFRRAYREALTAPRQNQLFRKMSVAYMWDDHDYGPNNSDMRAPGRPAALASYRQVVPHYPLAFSGDEAPVGQAFSVGRVRFIMPDLRSHRWHNDLDDGSEKTMMGKEQRAWFKRELKAAHETHALTVFVTGVPWIDSSNRSDSWAGYVHERKVISDFMVENGIDRVVALAGDAHMLAADDGSNNTFASDGEGPGFPVLHAAALDRRGSVKGGPYSEGTFARGGQFGLLRIEDEGHQIDMRFEGRNAAGEVLLALEASWEVPASVAARAAAADER